MFSFLKNLGGKKSEKLDKEINSMFKKLKELYGYAELTQERKEYLKNLIEENGYLPYPYVKALEELSPAEILYGLEIKFALNNVFKSETSEFDFENEKLSPAQRAGYKSGDWIKKEQHNIKLINLAGLGDGNKTQETGKLIDWLRQVLILPSGRVQDGVLGTTIYLIPFHPREFGCAYLPVSSEVSPHLEDKTITSKLGLDTKAQVQLFVKLAQLAGHCVIYDILPQTGRFSKMVLANPNVARWYDVNKLIEKIELAADEAAQKLKSDGEIDPEDIDIVHDIYKATLKKGSSDLSEHFQTIFNELEDIIAPKKKEFSDEMMKKASQIKIQKRAAEIVAEINELKPGKKHSEDDITKQGETIQKLISEGLWPAPGGAWCSAGTPVFDRMSETGDYPMFKHFDFKCEDVTHFANLDCQTPYYFVYLESGEYNKPVIDLYIEHLKKLQSDYNFDGFRVDHIDHIVDEVSEQDGVPISYRAPRCVLGRANKELKEKVPHFATLAEYMLWDKFYKEYHEDMHFDILWGNDIISQFSKNPEEIMNNNHDLAEYNVKNPNSQDGPLSILKSYNNQDGEFRAIDQYPGQLGERGAMFKWFKYKFLPGGKNATRPVMFIDGDESFTKTGIESVIGAEVSMPREKNYKFFDKFNAINKFALENELTREGEAQIITQDNDGFVSWMVSKDPLKESLLVVANYQAPTEKVSETNADGFTNSFIKEGSSVYDKTVQMPCDYMIVGEFVYDDAKAEFKEVKFEKPETELHFGDIKPSEFKIYKIVK
ncbi:MAG: hypothetical protein KHX03_08510 [Clostridium sp.]|nr:hypothetical protein [Clostridium sp.]